MTRFAVAAICLTATLCVRVTTAQVESPLQSSKAAATPIAYVYVSTSKGINLYDAASTGKLTLVAGSPFQTSGLMIGSNGKYFISLGTDYVHSYAIASNGGIGKQVSQMNTQSYGGAECGTTFGATLDHTGQYVYVSLDEAILNGDTFCATNQTFQISSSGVLSFKGDIVVDAFKSAQFPVVVAGDEKFAYSRMGIADACEFMIYTYIRGTTGTLEPSTTGQGESNPPAPPGGYVYYPNLMTEDPTNHLAVVLTPEIDPPCGTNGTPQIASFTEGSQGAITSTNTWQNMPLLPGGANALSMSPSGQVLAVATGGGVQFFHFNGASPITTFTGVLGTGGYSYLYWDNSNHLYAAGGKNLHVYTVSTTGAAEAPGSPYTITSAAGLVVVPK